MKGAERIYVYPEFTHSCTERGKGDIGYVREDLVDELREALEEILHTTVNSVEEYLVVRSRCKTALAKIKEEE